MEREREYRERERRARVRVYIYIYIFIYILEWTRTFHVRSEWISNVMGQIVTSISRPFDRSAELIAELV